MADEYQRRGIGTRLLEQLAALAGRDGDRALRRGRAAGQPPDARRVRGGRLRGHARGRRGEVELSFPIAQTERYLESVESRDHEAVVASLASVLRARVGRRCRRVPAARLDRRRALPQRPRGRLHRGRVSRQPLGASRSRASAATRRSRRSSDPVDLVVICVPGEHVLRRGRGRVPQGRARDLRHLGGVRRDRRRRRRAPGAAARARARARRRLIGPNCLGIASAAPRLNATFAAKAPPWGSIGFSSQSGALGLAVIEAAESRGIGLSAFVSIGNKAGRFLERSARAVRGRRRDEPDRPLPRVVRQSAQVRAHRAPRLALEADPRAEERADFRRGEGGGSHTAALELGRRRRRALQPGGRDPGRDASRSSSTPPCSSPRSRSARPARRRPDERRRPRDPGGRRLRGRGSRAPDALR